MPKIWKIFIQIIFLLSTILAVSQNLQARENISTDKIINKAEKEKIKDIADATNTTASKMLEFLESLLSSWDSIENYFPKTSRRTQKAIDAINRAGFKSKVKEAISKAKVFKDGSKNVSENITNLDKAVAFYNTYAPGGEDPYQSLTVIIGLFDTLESFLPKKDKYEAIKTPPVFLIRTAIAYFRSAVKNAKEGLTSIQKNIRKRAGNCIGYIGGDELGGSKKRQTFLKLGETDVICYTGIRPTGGEIWKNTDGDAAYLWAADKWTKLECNAGEAEDVFRTWRLAYANNIKAYELKKMCTKNLIYNFKKNKKLGGKYFEALLHPSYCQYKILDTNKKNREFTKFFKAIGSEKKVFVAKYIFKSKIRKDINYFYNMITNQILFTGRVNTDAEISIKAGQSKINTNTNSNRNFSALIRVDKKRQKGLETQIDAIAKGYKPYSTKWHLYNQCNNIPIELTANKKDITKNKQECTTMNHYTSQARSLLSKNLPVLMLIEMKNNTIYDKLNKYNRKIHQLELYRSDLETLAKGIGDNLTELENLSKNICQKTKSLNNYYIDENQHNRNFQWIQDQKTKFRNILDDSNNKFRQIKRYQKKINSKIITKDNMLEIKNLIQKLDIKKANNLYMALSKSSQYDCPKDVFRNIQKSKSRLSGFINNTNRIKKLFSKSEKLFEKVKNYYNKNDSDYLVDLIKSYVDKGRGVSKDGVFCTILAEDIMQKSFIPNVQGLDISTARRKLANRGFVVNEKSMGTVKNNEKASVVEQYSPKTKKRFKNGTVVSIYFYEKASASDKNTMNNACKKWPGSILKKNPATGNFSCYCIGDSVWNLSKTKCISRKEFAFKNSSCQQYPGSIKVWNNSSNRVQCRCQNGSVWNYNRTACIQDPMQIAMANANCNRYPKSTKVWNSIRKRVECACQGGLIWNKYRTACIPKQVQTTNNTNSFATGMMNILSGIANTNNNYHPNKPHLPNSGYNPFSQTYINTSSHTNNNSQGKPSYLGRWNVTMTVVSNRIYDKSWHPYKVGRQFKRVWQITKRTNTVVFSEKFLGSFRTTHFANNSASIRHSWLHKNPSMVNDKMFLQVQINGNNLTGSIVTNRIYKKNGKRVYDITYKLRGYKK